MSTTLNFDTPGGRAWVAYRNLGDGLNTLVDPSQLQRSEFQELTNAWYAFGKSLSKRPGSVKLPGFANAAISAGFTGAQAIVSGRFNDTTYVVVQQGNQLYAAPVLPSNTGLSPTWEHIGHVSPGGLIHAAQMYDPDTSKDTLFIVSGKDVPQMWQGPGTTLVDVDLNTGFLPLAPDSTPIHPKYVATLGNNSHLFYSGVEGAPTAVYISDAFFPERFTTPAMQVNPLAGAYLPAIIGLNDGVDGGSITGMQTLGSMMLIFKQAAIYAMVETQLLGNTAWQVYNVSPSVGCLSPRSIVAFDFFVLFLAIDGVYYTDGNTVQKVSVNVPSFFDSTKFGTPALINDRTTAVAVRMSNKYMIWFQTNDGTSYNNCGIWFDFDVMRADGLPAAGRIIGMNVAGAVPLRGPNDTGNIAWSSQSSDQTGIFGIGFTDFNTSIIVQVTLKCDMFEEEWGPPAPCMNKQVVSASLCVHTYAAAGGQTILFDLFVAANDLTNPLLGVIPSNWTNDVGPITVQPGDNGQSAWGSSEWGHFQWAATPDGVTNGYFVAKMDAQRNMIGQCLELSLRENSTIPWIVSGIIVELDAQLVAR